MSEAYAWRGRAENNEGHLKLTADQDARVRAAWERAARARPEFDEMMRDIKERTAGLGSRIPGDRAAEGVPEIDFSLKGLDSLRRKVAVEVAEDPYVDVAALCGRVNDLNRYTLTFEAESYTRGVQQSFQQLRDRGFEPLKVQNTWPDPVYKGINSVWEKRETGQRVEVQLHTPDGFRVKSENHAEYELARSGALEKEYGPELGAQYVDAANKLMSDRYEQCRKVNGQLLPIVTPGGHETISEPFSRVQTVEKVSEQAIAVVRGKIGSPGAGRGTAGEQHGQATATNPVALAARRRSGPGATWSQAQLPPQTGPVRQPGPVNRQDAPKVPRL